MEMTGEQRIAAPRQRVWEALNDPEVLRASIPGCQTLDKEGDTRFLATVEVKIGPIGARFKGDVGLIDLQPGQGYTIVGQGNGGIAGSAKGSAKVQLSDDGDGTLITYVVEAEVGGRMAQLGGPIIDATAKNLSAKFFGKFGEIVGGAGEAAAPSPAAAPSAPPQSLSPPPIPAQSLPQPDLRPAARSAPLWGWIAALVACLIAGYVGGSLGVPGTMMVAVLVLLVVTAAAAFNAGRHVGSLRE